MSTEQITRQLRCNSDKARGFEVRQTPTSARRLVAEDEFVKELVLVALEALRQRIC